MGSSFLLITTCMSNIKSGNLFSIIALVATGPLLITSSCDSFVIFIWLLFLCRIIDWVLSQVLATGSLVVMLISVWYPCSFSGLLIVGTELILAIFLRSSVSVLVFIEGDNVLIWIITTPVACLRFYYHGRIIVDVFTVLHQFAIGLKGVSSFISAFIFIVVSANIFITLLMLLNLEGVRGSSTTELMTDLATIEV